MRGIFVPSRLTGLRRIAHGSAALVLLLCAAPLLQACKQSEPPAPEPIAFTKKQIYSPTADPKADIAAAVTQATQQHKRILLDFGGDWCGDCQVLDTYFHQPPNTQLLADHFVVVHVDIGQMDHNVDIAAQYQVPIQKGVPALAVLGPSGKLLFSQENKEFENMRNMRSSDVTDFLNRWKS